MSPEEIESEGPLLAARIDAALAKRFAVKQGAKSAFSPTGETYTELVVTMKRLADIERAVIGAVSAFGKDGDTLYWRVAPDFDHTSEDRDFLKCYCRFLVTDRPVTHHISADGTIRPIQEQT